MNIIGQREGVRTEFKRADALKDPSNIAREVVAFLNMEGGDIWIGVGELEGMADSLEAIPDPEHQRGRLQDALVDLIEPSPIVGTELDIHEEPFSEDGTQKLLRVSVQPGQRRPYALLRQTARAYLVRTGSRLRPMTREEIAEAFKGASSRRDRVSEVVGEVEADLHKWADDGFAGMKILVRPTDDPALGLDKAMLEPLLRDPSLTGNRMSGWNFTSDYLYLKSFHRSGRAGYEFREEQGRWLTMKIWQRGDIELSIDLDRLHWKGPPQSIWPFALLEFPASVMRLAKKLYEAATRPEQVVLGMGLFQIRGWKLAPHSPASWSYGITSATSFDEEDHFFGNPIVVTRKELDESPDRCAYRLVRQVYEAFGFEERQIPQEYNRETGQLTFPR